MKYRDGAGAGLTPASASHILFVLFLLFSLVAPSWAEMITYRDVVRDTLQHSARIRMKAEDVNISTAIYRQNVAGLYPEVSVISRFEKHENLDQRNVGINTINGEIVGGDTSAWRSSAYLLGQYYFSHWYKKRFEASYYERIRDMRVHELDMETKKIVRELTDIFSAVAEGKIKLRYGTYILKCLKDVFRLKKEAFEKGYASYEEVLKIEADVAAAEKEMGSVRKEVRENLEKLYSYTGNIYGDNVDVELLISSPQAPSTDAAKLIESAPEYKARLKELEAAKFKSKAVSNNFLPDISLYGRYDFYGSNPDALNNAVRDFRQTAYSAGVMISLPLFDGGVRKWDRQRNLYEISKQNESVKAIREEKGRDIKTIQAGYQELSRSLVHYRKLADQYKKILGITKKAHGLGERSQMDLMEVEKDALTVERDCRVTEHTLAVYEKRLALEVDFEKFINEHEAGIKRHANRQ